MSWGTGAGPPAAEAPAAERRARSRRPASRPAGTVPWAELHCHSSFSFLDGAATPGELGTVFGAELTLGLPANPGQPPDPEGRHLLVLARDAEGYRRLCAVISAAQLAG